MRFLRHRISHNWRQLGLCPRPRWRSLQHYPDPLARFKKSPQKNGDW